MFKIMKGTSYTRKGDGVTVCRIRVQGPKIDGKQAVKDFKQEDALLAQEWCAKMNEVLRVDGVSGVKREMGWGEEGVAKVDSVLTIGQVVREFLTSSWHSVVARDITQSTYDLYVATLQKKFMVYLDGKKNLPCSKLDRKLMQGFMDWLLTLQTPNGGTLAVSTRKTMKIHMQAFVKWCVNQEYISIIEMNKVVVRGEDDWSTKVLLRDKAVAVEDVTKVMEHISAYYRPIARFLAYTGCRVSEACNLRWESVVIEEGGAWVSFVPYTLDNGTRYRPKTENSVRKIWVESTVLEAMKEGGSEGTAGYVFRSISDRTSKVSEKSLSFIISRAFRELGYPKRVSCHAFRHTNITIGADAGIPIPALMNRVGIGTTKIMEEYYNQTDNNDKKLGKVFDNEIKGS